MVMMMQRSALRTLDSSTCAATATPPISAAFDAMARHKRYYTMALASPPLTKLFRPYFIRTPCFATAWASPGTFAAITPYILMFWIFYPENIRDRLFDGLWTRARAHLRWNWVMHGIRLNYRNEKKYVYKLQNDRLMAFAQSLTNLRVLHSNDTSHK